MVGEKSFEGEYASPVVDNQSASVIQIESNKLLPMLVFSIGLSMVSMTIATFCLYQLSKAEREDRLVDNDWQQMNAFLAREGVTKDPNGFYIRLGKPPSTSTSTNVEKETSDGR